MRIAIDAVGGDNAPDEIIAGVLESIKQLDKDDELILVGPEDIIESQLKSRKYPKGAVTIVHAPDIIGAHGCRRFPAVERIDIIADGQGVRRGEI